MKTLPAKQITGSILVCLILLLITVFVPYHEDESFLSGIHLFAAYASFALYNVIVYFSYHMEKLYKNMYVPGLFLAAMLALLSGEISAAAETVFAIIVLILTGMCF